MLQHIGRDVVPIESPTFSGMRWRHGATGRAEEQSLQERRGLRAGAGSTLPWALAENAVDLVPERFADDRLVLARIRRALVDRLADVHAVSEQLIDIALVDEAPALPARAFVS